MTSTEEAEPTSAPTLSFRTTVERGLVHRWALGEVFVTDVVSVGEDRFLCAAQLPRSHAYFGDGASKVKHFDPLMLVEVCRQAALLVAHDFYGVPHDYKFILNGVDIDIVDVPALRVTGRPGEFVADAAITDRKVRKGQVTGLRYTAVCSLNGVAIGTVSLGLLFNSPTTYQLLRDRDRVERELPVLEATDGFTPWYRTYPVEPFHVGRLRTENVVIGPLETVDGELSAALVVDPSHPSMFDHPQDHVPGMVMSEAFRQAAIAAAAEAHALNPAKAVLRRCVMTNFRFGELELGVVARVTDPGTPVRDGNSVTTAMSVRLEQDGQIISSAEVELVHQLGLGH